MERDRHPINEPSVTGFGLDRLEALGRVVDGVHVEAAAGEVERVASLARAQLEHSRGTRRRERVGRGNRRVAGLVPVHLGMSGEGRRPVLSLLVRRRHDNSVILIPARRREACP